MNSMPHPWNKAKHIVNSSKTEQTAGAGDHLQICYSLLLRAVCRPCHTNEDWFICVSWLGWNRMLIWLICFTSRLGPKVCVCACFPAVSLSVSHTVGYRLGLLRLFFPKPNRLCGFSIRISHPQVSDLLTMSPVKVSVMPNRDRIRLWPLHPEPKRADVGIHLPSTQNLSQSYSEILDKRVSGPITLPSSRSPAQYLSPESIC